MSESPDYWSNYATCWRCGRDVLIGETSCPHCAAPLSTAAPAVSASQSVDGDLEGKLAMRMLAIAGLTILVSIIFFNIARNLPEITDAGLLKLIGLIAGIDLVIVLVGLGWIRPLPELKTTSSSRRIAAWILAPILLAGLLGLNFWWSDLLRRVLNSPVEIEEFPALTQYLVWYVVLVCIYPAIAEELLFRFLAIRVLHSATGTHGAVWISAVMFGLAHLANPLGIPYLILVGAALGYLYAASRSLLLPMIVHFLHNGIVLWAELI